MTLSDIRRNDGMLLSLAESSSFVVAADVITQNCCSGDGDGDSDEITCGIQDVRLLNHRFDLSPQSPNTIQKPVDSSTCNLPRITSNDK